MLRIPDFDLTIKDEGLGLEGVLVQVKKTVWVAADLYRFCKTLCLGHRKKSFWTHGTILHVKRLTRMSEAD